MTDEEVVKIYSLLERMSSKTRITAKDKEEINEAIRIIEPVKDNIEVKQLRKKYKEFRFSYSNYNPEREISRMLQAMTNSISLYKEAKNDLHVLDSATQDILHSLEMCDIPLELEKELLNELKVIRVQRRRCKNFIELVEPLKIFAEKRGNLTKEIIDIQKHIAETITDIESRKYYPRVKTELNELFENVPHTYMLLKLNA